MVQKAAASAQKVVSARPLPPLHKLRIRNPDKPEANPCVAVMASVLGCWASSGHNVAGCMLVEQQLRACMDAPPRQAPRKSNINFHLSRLYPQMKGPHKKGLHPGKH